MRPLSLAIEGFTAFRDRQDIDFAPLDLFVITGPTGAGKTSILDAMVFALYGQVPRLGGKWGTSDLVSLGKVQARVQFEFSVYGKGRYRVARRLKRGASQEATLERHEGGDWVPACERSGVRECDRALIDLLGLDFDAFCKAVVLPQGEFHRFLKGDPKERRHVLVSLLGVSYFQRMAELARRRGSDLTARVSRTEEILADQYADATAERVAELRTVASGLTDRASTLAAAVLASDRYAGEAAGHGRRAEALGTHATELADILVGLGDQSDACREAEADQRAAAAALETAANVLQAGRQAAQDAEARVAALEADAGTLEQIAKSAAAAETLRVAAGQEQIARTELVTAEERESAGRQELEAAEARESGAQATLDAAQAAEQEAQTEFEQKRDRQLERAQQLDEARKRYTELATAQEQVTVAAATAEGAHAEAERLLGLQQDAVAHLEDHRRVHAVAELAHGLAAGDPCPVCGIALADAVEVAGDAAKTLETARAAETAARAAAEAAGRAVARADADLERAQAHERGCEAQLAGDSDVADLEALLESASADLAQAEAAFAAARTARERLEAERGRVHDEVLNMRGEVGRLEAVTTGARRSLAEIRTRRDDAADTLTERFGSPVPDDAAERIQNQRNSLRAATEAARHARGELDGAAARHDEARAAVEAGERRLGQIDVHLAQFRTRAEAVTRAADALLEDSLDDLPVRDVSRQAAASGLVAWAGAAADAVAGAAGAAATARNAAEAAIAAIATENRIEFETTAQALIQLRSAERDAATTATRAQSAVDEAIRRTDERTAMEERIKDEQERIIVLGALAHELRADRFGEYIVEETLGLLATRASEELLRISDGRYSLVPVEGDFHVVDHANADERRSVKTLSGGETFLASLALALALSRHVGDLATEGLGAKLEAVFIDEGFGSLDPATLEEVIDALERLRAEDLVVGVISHVPELAQRVRSGLEVQKDEGRSRIVAVADT